MIRQTLTDEFVECYQEESDYKGVFSRIVATGELPEGVDPEDERVKAIIQKCREVNSK
jgi:hypothetical protein